MHFHNNVYTQTWIYPNLVQHLLHCLILVLPLLPPSVISCNLCQSISRPLGQILKMFSDKGKEVSLYNLISTLDSTQECPWGGYGGANNKSCIALLWYKLCPFVCASCYTHMEEQNMRHNSIMFLFFLLNVYPTFIFGHCTIIQISIHS